MTPDQRATYITQMEEAGEVRVRAAAAAGERETTTPGAAEVRELAKQWLAGKQLEREQRAIGGATRAASEAHGALAAARWIALATIAAVVAALIYAWLVYHS
jgi:hypothetical protein